MKSTSILAVLILFCLAYFSCTKDPMQENIPPDQNWVYDPSPVQLVYPDWFPILEIPADNPTTKQGVKLGRMLYYDPILHADSSKACAGCHLQEYAFSTPGNIIPHINLGWSKAFLWNGKLQGSLDDAMLFEVKDFFKTDLDRLQNHPDYPRLFYEAFGTVTLTYEQAANALAQFQRTMISSNSRYDQVLAPGTQVFLTDEEVNGYDLFFTEKGDCFHCHGGILFTDQLFHNNGLDADPDPGHQEVSGNPFDLGKFKTPTLRNIALTAPYMHDGRYETLEEVIDFYSEGLDYSETIDPLMKFAQQGGVQLTEQEKSDLIAFLKTLTDTVYINNPGLASPFD